MVLSTMMARVLRPLGHAASWLVAATVAYALALSSETFRHLGEAGSRAGELTYIGELSILMTLYCSAPLAALHLIARGLDHRWPRRAPGAAVTMLLVGAAAGLPAWEQADFLTSGAGAEELPHVELLRYGLAAGLVLMAAMLWFWHLDALAPRQRTQRLLSRIPKPLRLAVWYTTGLSVLSVLIYVLSFELKAYAFFATYMLVPTWFIAGTLGYRLMDALRWHPAASLVTLAVLWGGVLLLGQGAAPQRDRARTTYMRRGMVAALTDLRVYPSNTELASFALDDSQDVRCPPHPQTRPLPALATPPKRRRNVILLSVDAMRADAPEYTHDGRHVMPGVRRFRRKAVDFRRAVTTYPATLLAMGGALTGLDSSQLLFAPKPPKNVFALTRDRFDRQLISLPKSKWFKRKIAKRLLLQHGKVVRDKNAKAQVDWFLKQLRTARRHKQTVLGWLHLYEPHHKYKTHRGYDFGDSEAARYMSELAYVDRHLSRVFDFLERSRYYRDSLVVLFADHGEAMGERDYYGHHVYLNGWITDIPMMVRAPDLPPRVSRELVDITDVALTVLQFAGVDAPYLAEGVSLLEPEGARAGRVSIAEAFPSRGGKLFKLAQKPTRNLKAFRKRVDKVHGGAKNYLPKVAAITAEHRLIVNRVTGLQELYDREADPRERYDLSWDGLPVHDWLQQRLRQWSQRKGKQLYCEVMREQQDRARRARGVIERTRKKSPDGAQKKSRDGAQKTPTDTR
jgi:arylsulfatase A-like enzyme